MYPPVHTTHTIGNYCPADTLRAIKVDKAQVEILPIVDEHPERVPLGSSYFVWYGACPLVLLSYPETRVVLFIKGLVAAQSVFRGPDTPLVWLM